MGKANKPLVVRIRPGESQESALARALAKPRYQGKSPAKILIRKAGK